MPSWKLVAEGENIEGLQATVPDFALPTGTDVKFTMDLKMPVASLFNLAGVEHLFSLPEGLTITDVHGEGWSTAVIEAKANSPWLLAVLAFVRAHWLIIVVSGFILAALVGAVKVTANIAEAVPTEWLKWGILAVALYFGYQAIFGGGTKKRAPP